MIDIWWGELKRHQPEGYTIYRAPGIDPASHLAELETDPDVIRKAAIWASGVTFLSDQMRILKWYPRLVTEPTP